MACTRISDLHAPLRTLSAAKPCIAADLACSGTVPDEHIEHLAHRPGVAAHDRGGGLDVAGGIKTLPGERESGAAGELLEEGPLCPPVSLTERVQGVDLAEVAGQPPEERVTAQVMQEALAAQLLLSRPDCADGRQKHHNLCGYRNLGGRCRTHHVLKQESGWTLRQPRPGYFELTTPSGHTYSVEPDAYPL
jgi:hypothetical protein